MTIGNVTIRQLQDSIDAHRRLLSASNQKAVEAQQQLIRIGLEFCGRQFDQLQKEGVVLETASPEILGSLIVNSLKITLSGLDHQNLNSPERVHALNRRIEALQREVDAQTRRANLAEDRNLQLQRQTSTLDQSLTLERRKGRDSSIPTPSDPPAGEAADYSDWFELWAKRKGYERDKQIIIVLGQTGYSRLSEIQQTLVQKLNMGDRTAYRAVEACVQEGLIERRSGSSTQGRPTDLVLLTVKGKWTYTRLSGQAPKAGEYEALLKSHKSERHTALILKTADLFSLLGFEIEREPIQIKLSENRYFQPDLVARKDGEVFYLEVESGEREERASLLQKWENAFMAGGGRISVVTPRPGLMNTVQSMILNWATENGKKPSLYLTHLEYLRKLGPSDRPWARIR
jgi:hypothetical protein